MINGGVYANDIICTWGIKFNFRKEEDLIVIIFARIFWEKKGNFVITQLQNPSHCFTTTTKTSLSPISLSGSVKLFLSNLSLAFKAQRIFPFRGSCFLLHCDSRSSIGVFRGFHSLFVSYLLNSKP